MVSKSQNPVTVKGAGADSKNQAGKWYMITWGWLEYDQDDHDKELSRSTSEVVFIPTGGSIARHILGQYKQFMENGEVYTLGEPGEEFIVCCGLSSLVLLTPDGQKISGFKPKSIAHLCEWKN